MTVEFHFNIGDIVAHKTALHPYPLATHKFQEPQRLLILGRVADECPGGIQKHYRVRPVTDQLGQASFTRDLFSLHEEEVVAYPEPTATRA